MEPHEAGQYINTFKTVLETAEYNDHKRKVQEEAAKSEDNEKLDKSIDDIIGSGDQPTIDETNEVRDAEYELLLAEQKRVVKDAVIDRLTGMELNVDHKTKAVVNKYIGIAVNAAFEESTVDIAEEIKNDVTQYIQSEVGSAVNGTISQYTGQIIGGINEAFAGVEDPTGITPLVGGYVSSVVGQVAGAAQTAVTQLLTTGTVDPNLLDNLNENITKGFDNLGEQIGNQVEGTIRNGVRQLSDKLGIDIEALYNKATQEIDKEGKAKKAKESEEAAAKAKESDKATEGQQQQQQGATDSTEQQQQTQQQQEQQASVKDREQNDPSNAQPDPNEQQQDTSEPQPKQYDNKPPQPAQGKSDPRRKCQELVLWDTDSEHYVLLRDRHGNYIHFNEDSDTVRIQQKSGTYIELTGSAIRMDAPKIFLNCSSPSYIEKF